MCVASLWFFPEPEAGDRIAVHFDVKLRNLTVATSRQGSGVTGGSPYGFQVGLNPGDAGAAFIKGMDLGVLGMKVSSQHTETSKHRDIFREQILDRIFPRAVIAIASLSFINVCALTV